MPSFSTDHTVSHSATEMFDLVADIEAYPEFVPLCRGMKVLSRDRKDGREIIRALMTVSYSFLKETFSSHVECERKQLTILVYALDGPFKRLESNWAFEAIDEDSCQVHFSIDYEFRSRTLGLLMGTVFDRAFRRFAAAFEERADVVYRR